MTRHRSRSISLSPSPQRSSSPRRSPSPQRSPARRYRHDVPSIRGRDSHSGGGGGGYRQRPSDAPTGLLVRNISLQTRTEDIRSAFERFGPLKDVYLPKNFHTGMPRGFGFVKFHHGDDALKAKEHMQHKVIHGREIMILFADEKRKSPYEMRNNSRISERYDGRRRFRSPRQRYRSYSRSRSPSPRHYSRDQRSRRSVSRSPTKRRDRRQLSSLSPVRDSPDRRGRRQLSNLSPVRDSPARWGRRQLSSLSPVGNGRASSISPDRRGLSPDERISSPANRSPPPGSRSPSVENRGPYSPS